MALLATLSACDTQNPGTLVTTDGGEAVMNLPTPDPILFSRMVVQDNLRLFITVQGQGTTEVQRDPDTDEWRLTTTLPAGQTTDVTIEWYETAINGAPDPGLLLATATRPITVNAQSQGETVSIVPPFDTSHDLDGDRRSNLAERNAGSDPTSASDPGDEVPLVPLVLDVRLPQMLAGEDVDTEVIEGLVALAVRNPDGEAEPIALERAGANWSGEVSVPQSGQQTVRIRIYQDASNSTQLAERTSSINVDDDGVTLVFPADDYLTAFDDDNDEIDNIDEVAAGTSPDDSSDPGMEPPEGETEPDGDNDTIPDATDNCPDIPNAGQEDADGDMSGDLCDETPNGEDEPVDEPDGDMDDVPDDMDNCPIIPNTNQADVDEDMVGNVCDNCPDDFNPGQADTGGDPMLGDACETPPPNDEEEEEVEEEEEPVTPPEDEEGPTPVEENDDDGDDDGDDDDEDDDDEGNDEQDDDG